MLKLFYITNRPEVARIAERAGVDRIFVDLETIGKAQRQGGMDTVQSHHTINDAILIKQTLTTADLLVRSNPIHEGTPKEIDAIVASGADYIMLPYFKSAEEVARFIDQVDGRAKTIPLVETKEAVDCIDEILELDGIDEIYIGLNDLHLSYGMRFMFQLLADGTVDRLASTFQAKGIPFGFGGIARINTGVIPGAAIIKEHYRLGSTLAILSRSFCNTDINGNLGEIEAVFMKGMKDIRALEREAAIAGADYFYNNHQAVVKAVNEIIK